MPKFLHVSRMCKKIIIIYILEGLENMPSLIKIKLEKRALQIPWLPCVLIRIISDALC